MRVEDKKINELLEKTQNYRKDLASSIMSCSNFELLDLKELEDIFQSNVDIEDKKNICIEYPITRKEATAGSTKEIKYNRINEKGKEEVNTITVKIPKGIQDNASILIHREGNYIKETKGNSDLIINIKVK